MDEINFDGHIITEEESNNIKEQFVNPVLSDIDKIIYMDCWADYEEYVGELIYINKKQQLMSISYGYVVMGGAINQWNPTEITKEQALEEINRIIEINEEIRRQYIKPTKKV